MDKKISAGSYDLNKFLFGGYETDIITTIYGPGGSGKTNFCILVALSQARKGNKIMVTNNILLVIAFTFAIVTLFIVAKDFFKK